MVILIERGKVLANCGAYVIESMMSFECAGDDILKGYLRVVASRDGVYEKAHC